MNVWCLSVCKALLLNQNDPGCDYKAFAFGYSSTLVFTSRFSQKFKTVHQDPRS